MTTICGLDCACCQKCDRREACGGCVETDGHPFGGSCAVAECVKAGGLGALAELKAALIGEFNALGIKDLHIKELNLLPGFYINLEYRLPNGQSVKLLEDGKAYFGNQIEIPESDRCYGVAADDAYLLVCEYGCGGADPQIVRYQRR